MTIGVQILGDIDDLLGTVENAGAPFPYASAYTALFGRVFLYELTVYNRNLAGTWLSPLGDMIPLGTVPPGVSTLNGEAVMRFSDTGYISGPNDSVSSVSFDGIVQTGLRLTRALPATPEQERRVNLDVGSFALMNDDGGMDAVVRGSSVDGRRIVVKFGLDSYPYDYFTPIFTGRMVQWSNSLRTVSVAVRDETYRLAKPAQTDLYDGTGAYNGGADLTGKPRPLCFGKVLNISPPMIESTKLIYQVHSRAISAIDAVYDRGATVTAGADYATYALLAAAAVGAGTYATCLAFGLFRLGSTPSGLITADVRGDAAGGYVDTTGDIAKRVLKDLGGITDAEIDLASFSDFTALVTGAIGYWQPTTAINVDALLNLIFGHCGAWWGADYSGYFQCGRIAEPDASKALLPLDYGEEPFDIEILDPLPGTFPPRFRQRVGYKRNWTPQQDTDLAGAVTASRRQFLAEGIRVVSSADLLVLNSFLLAIDPEPHETLFDADTDASALAAVWLALYKAPRQTIRAKLDMRGLPAKLGFTVLVTHPRLNGGIPTAMLCMTVAIVADNRQTELVLWG